MRKERFPKLCNNKLKPRASGPYKILKKIGENAYELELPKDWQVHSTFNVANLMPYEPLEDDDMVPTRPTNKDFCKVPSDGPITRNRAKKIQEEMQKALMTLLDRVEVAKRSWSTLLLMEVIVSRKSLGE